MSRDNLTPWAEDDIDQLRYQLDKRRTRQEWVQKIIDNRNLMAQEENDLCCSSCGHFVCSCPKGLHLHYAASGHRGSTYLMTQAMQTVYEGKSVAYISLGESEEEVFDRILRMGAVVADRMTLRSLFKPTPEEFLRCLKEQPDHVRYLFIEGAGAGLMPSKQGLQMLSRLTQDYWVMASCHLGIRAYVNARSRIAGDYRLTDLPSQEAIWSAHRITTGFWDGVHLNVQVLKDTRFALTTAKYTYDSATQSLHLAHHEARCLARPDDSR